MCQVAEAADELQALKQQLSELENLKLLSPEDLEVLDVRRALRLKLTVMEKERPKDQAADHKKPLRMPYHSADGIGVCEYLSV